MSRGRENYINIIGHMRYKKTSRTAFLSLVLGFVGIVLFGVSFLGDFSGGVDASALLSTVAIGCAACGVAAIYRRGLKGILYVALGVILSLPSVTFVTVAAVCVHERAEFERTNTGIYNLRVLGKAMAEYAKDHDGKLPDSNSWCDSLCKYDKRLSADNFRHPRIKGNVIAFNIALSGLRLRDIRQDIVLLFEAQGGWNLAGGEELLAKEAINRDRVNILLVNREIETYWIEYGGVKGPGEGFRQPSWKP